MMAMSMLTAVLVASLLGMESGMVSGRTLASAKIATEFKKPWFCHDLDCPVYTVQEQNDVYEVRKYEAGSWVSTEETGFQYDAAVRKGFWKLFKYIGGENESRTEIPMTAPVRVSVTPGAGPFCKDFFKISFFVPYNLQGKAPKPSNSEVFVEENDEFVAYVVSYGGWNNVLKFSEAAAQLTKHLQKRGVAVRPDLYYTAGYDSPFRLLNRHNEVWLLSDQSLQERQDSTASEIVSVE